MEQSFLPMLFRMKHITRWGLMHTTQPENLSLHSAECAFLAHFLAVIGNVYFDASHDPDKLAAYALFHDAPEILTGDLPTPVKYFNNEFRGAYKDIEDAAAAKLLLGLPLEMRESYAGYITGVGLSETEADLVKAADNLCAYIKCLIEINAGNREFEPPLRACREKVLAKALVCPEVQYFLDHFAEAFTLSLDALQGTL